MKIKKEEQVTKVTPKNDISKKEKKKKKKKKKHYKDMMAAILKPKLSEEERNKIKQDAMKENSLGGGSFKKIEVI